MVKRLIVNADDYGLTEGVTLGIIKGHKDGIITSTTAMMNMPFVTTALEWSKNFPDLKIGVHLVLTMGKALTNGKTIQDENGNFIRPAICPKGYPVCDLEEVYQEWKAQIEKYIELTGHKPSHLDSHHHIALREEYIPVLLRLAKEYDLPVRQREKIDDRYEYASFLQAQINQIDPINDVLKRDVEVFELMVHPAFVDMDLMNCSSFNIGRLDELAFVLSKEAKDTIQESSILLTTHDQLKKL